MRIEQITEDIINGRALAHEQAHFLCAAPLFDLLHHANMIREHFKGNAINLCSIINAKSGRCTENCMFCAQSGHHKTSVQEYPLIDISAMSAAFKNARKNGSCCFSVVTSGRALSSGEIDEICGFMRSVKGNGVRLSASLGELDAGAFKKLKESGLQRFHHNIETSRSFYSSICTTHRFDDRIATVKRAKEAGLEVCCGGILGLGESIEQRIEFALTLSTLEVDSIPLNFLNPVPGTPLENQGRLSCGEILRAIAMFRFVLPDKDISVCGGREVNLRDMQSWIFYAGANGMMSGGYLTTPGRSVEQDLKMIEDLGLNTESKRARE